MKAPKFPSVFKSRGPRQFTFTPRYYNEQKEAHENRREAIKRELAFEQKTGQTTEEFEETLTRNWKREHKKRANISGSFRMLIIILGLLYIFYQLYVNIDTEGIF